MSAQMWTAVGLVLGGVTSFLAQEWLRRSSERAEARRRAAELAETRRAERLTHLISFLKVAQEAERVAVDRYHHGLEDEGWHARARQTEDQLWVIQKTIHMLCTASVNEATRRLAFALQHVVRNGPTNPGKPQDEKVWEYIRPSRRAFLDAAAEDLAGSATEQ
jgi:hypothetical protein